LVFVGIHRLEACVVFLVFVGIHRLEACATTFSALERPEEEGRQAGVLFNRPGCAVAGLRLGGAEDLLQRRPADDLPDLLQILGQFDHPPFGSLDLRITAEYLQRRADAGEYQVRAANPFTMEPLHPVAHAPGQLAQHVRPVAHRRIVGTRPTDEVNTRGEGGGFHRTKA